MSNNPTYEEIKRNSQVIGAIITWRDLKKDSEIEWAEFVGIKRSAFVYGNFGVGGKCSFEGSNDKKNVGKLHGAGFGMDINIKRPNEFVEINEISRFIRPTVNGDETTNLTISIMVII